jgi:hypothetical protein
MNGLIKHGAFSREHLRRQCIVKTVSETRLIESVEAITCREGKRLKA